jgi:hypothetical protein
MNIKKANKLRAKFLFNRHKFHIIELNNDLKGVIKRGELDPNKPIYVTNKYLSNETKNEMKEYFKIQGFDLNYTNIEEEEE